MLVHHLMSFQLFLTKNERNLQTDRYTSNYFIVPNISNLFARWQHHKRLYSDSHFCRKMYEIRCKKIKSIRQMTVPYAFVKRLASF